MIAAQPEKKEKRGLFAGRLRRAREDFLDRYFYSLGDRTVTCQVHGEEILLKVGNTTEAFRAKTYEEKEPETLVWLENSLRAGDVLFDIGANIGLYTLYAAKKNPEVTVYAFEPQSTNFMRLCQNTFINRLNNVIPSSIALSSESKWEYFYASDVVPGTAYHSLGGINENRHHGKSFALRQGGFSHTIDELVANGLPVPNHIKLDVDGYEEKIVRGAVKTLENPQLRTVLVEVTRSPNEVEPIAPLIESKGFQLSSQGEINRTQSNHAMQNLIFERR